MAETDEEAANAPLMQEDENEAPDYCEVSHSQESELTSPSAFIWALTFTAGISGLLFGYEYVCLRLSLQATLTVDTPVLALSPQPSSPSKVILAVR